MEAAVIGSTAQAWLFAMTSGLASALGGATLYLDPLLHLLGMRHSYNILDSHTVLSAMLASASGVMAYTSISVLTHESIDYFSEYSQWSWTAKYPGAASAVLFLLGAHLNLLMARVVSWITPKDSPIKHTCSSHTPSPCGSDREIHAGLHDGRHSSVSNELWPLLVHCGETSAMGAVASDSMAQSSTSSPPETCRSEPPCCVGENGCRCEYACPRPRCYPVEHCHITPLYPHVHTHGHAPPCPGSGEEAGAEHPHNKGSSQHHGQGHLAAAAAANNGHSGGASPNGHTDHCSHSDAHSHASEPEVRLAGPGNSSTSQVSIQHQRLLIHVGFQTAIAIALHKIPEGLIIYLSREASPRLGVSVAASLFFHNLPEGLMLALPLFLATGRRHMAFGVASLMGAMPPAIGAGLGMLVLSDIGHGAAKLSGIFAIAFGITAGMMCMVSLNGMLPTARIYDKSGNVVAWCFALGVALMLFANTTLK